MDYAKPYKGVSYFGLFADATADTFGLRDAMADLAAAIEQTEDQDLRQDRRTLAALGFLEDHGGHQPAAKAFQAALSIQHPTERRQALAAAYARLRRSVYGGISDAR